ncbi:DUF3180 family protein [Serinibacter salmoneus]|uniref:Uncharacterized protein DUF3180 n=1 Tax=Serinibacter salmoneus TaxID=556530 RepID=A0A2A9D432_9MICO|nr:DUF3180 family protein [Serinibacter salmoneus]PFG20610.1 uncharacterized protein DUF3180 [Serinibacter salmoneus]
MADRPQSPARALPALALGSGSFALSLLVLMLLDTRGVTIPAPRILIVLLLGFALVLLWLGNRVRGFVRGRRSMEPIAAARVAALAVTAYYVSAVFIGHGAAWLASLMGSLGAPAARADAWVAVAMVVVSVLLFAVALLVLHWCRTPREEERRGPDGPEGHV